MMASPEWSNLKHSEQLHPKTFFRAHFVLIFYLISAYQGTLDLNKNVPQEYFLRAHDGEDEGFSPKEPGTFFSTPLRGINTTPSKINKGR